MNDHADFEALSAFVDGEAPECGAHVAACPSCQATVDALQVVKTAVAEPVDEATPAPPERDRHLVAAMGVDRGRLAPPGHRRRPVRWPVPVSIAALFVLIAGAVALLGHGGYPANQAHTGPRAPEADRPAQAPLGDGAGGQAGPSTRGSISASAATVDAYLGDIPDAATLLDRAGPSLAAARGATIGNAGSAAGGSGAPGVVGPRPCEEQARGREPDLREVVYFATASGLGVPAYVLGFSTGPAPAPVTLLLLARDGCGALLRAVGP